MKNTVAFLGAGFAAACGLPTTSEVNESFLRGPRTDTTDGALQSGLDKVLSDFWNYTFGYSQQKGALPSLEDHFTLIDSCANSGHSLGKYDAAKLRAIRRFSIHRVFDIINCRKFDPDPAAVELVREAAEQSGTSAIITTNWDLAVERCLVRTGPQPCWYGLPSHSASDGRPRQPEGLKILKLHGSSNWAYCDRCRQTTTGPAHGSKIALESGMFVLPRDLELFGIESRPEDQTPVTCPVCRDACSARVATFSFQKALGFFPFYSGWELALQQLQGAARWRFVGYSLPQADFAIRSLLKVAQASHREGQEPEVEVICGSNPETILRYRAFFGRRAKIYAERLEDFSASSIPLH